MRKNWNPFSFNPVFTNTLLYFSCFTYYFEPFNIPELTRAVTIHQQSYRFLLWLTKQLDLGKITLSRDHDNERLSEAILDWLSQIYDYLPETIRPDPEYLPEFCEYFATYLTVSFELTEEPDFIVRNTLGCYCPLCIRMERASHLQLKKPSKKDKLDAKEKREASIRMLAEEIGVQLSYKQMIDLFDDPIYLRASAYLAYAQCLLDRVRGNPTGVYVLILWRQIAWKPQGSPIKGFQLKVKDILNARQQMIEAIRKIG